MRIHVMGRILHRRRSAILILCMSLIVSQWYLYHIYKEKLSLRGSFKPIAPYLKLQKDVINLINTSEPYYPFKGSYVHEDKKFCSSVRNLTLLVIILSSTRNFLNRQTLRQTWTNGTYYQSYGTIKTAFLLGTVKDIDTQTKIDKEFQLYRDIIQGDFLDSYHNLTYKSTMGFRWVTERCRNARYVLKSDDDIIINLFKLFENNTFSESKENFHVYCHQQNHRIIRDSKSKWFVDENHFKGLKMYPTYCGGSFILISNKVVPYFYESLKMTPFFWIEDVLLYGIGLANVQGLTHKQIRGENLNIYNPNNSITCLNEKRNLCPIFVTMTVNVTQMQIIWEKMIEVHKI